MKIITKHFVLALLTLFIVNTSIAQMVSFGPMIGTDISTFLNVLSINYILGLSAGEFINYSVNENVGINGNYYSRNLARDTKIPVKLYTSTPVVHLDNAGF
jgi:hypothetical protein